MTKLRIAALQLLLLLISMPAFGIEKGLIQSGNGSLVEVVERVSDDLLPRDSDRFRVPTPGQIKAWKFIVESIYAGKPEDAAQMIKQLSFPYELKRFTEKSNGREYFLLTERAPFQSGWGAYVFDPKASNPLVIQAPHPKFDSKTEHQAIDAFLQTGASAFMLAGAHRRANKLSSPCTQPTSGDDAATYPVSDVAHAVDTPFHAVHEALIKARPGMVAVQLHGMGERENCPNVFISTGTATVTTNSKKLNGCLAKNGVESSVFDGSKSCPLIALSNVQGRFSNGETKDPCRMAARISPEPGTFIHIEQEPSIRKDRASWQPVIEGLKCAFPVSNAGSAVASSTQETPQSYAFKSGENPAVTVFYHLPPKVNEKTKVVLVLAGRQRNADEYLASWTDWATKNNYVVLSPRFAEADWPEPLGYNFGNIASGREANNTPNPKSKWAFTVVEEMFEDARKRFSVKADKYVLFGHSAGGQFVHRFMLFMPENKVTLAIAANPGFYTLPDRDAVFPYGLKRSPVPIGEKDLKEWARRNLVIMRGTADVQRTENLRQTPEADAQGKNRFERAGYMFVRINRLDPGTKWRLFDVPGIAHDQKGMAAAAQRFLSSEFK